MLSLVNAADALLAHTVPADTVVKFCVKPLFPASVKLVPAVASESKSLLRATQPDVTPGRPDNTMALGQSINAGKSGSKLTFLTAANNDPQTGAITVHYTDGTVATPQLNVGNFWFPAGVSGNPPNTPVAAVNYANYPNGSSGHTVYVFAASIPLDPAKTVRDITLPALSDVKGYHAALHIFAMTVS